jgi:Amt family ammonium transporter
MVLSVIGLERAGIDDPVGAISVHGTCGLWGVLAVGIFASGDGVTIVNQAIGAGAIIAWTFATSFIVFKLVDVTVGLRVTPEEEIRGLDRSEHGSTAYPEFVFQEQIADPKLLDPVGSNGA